MELWKEIWLWCSYKVFIDYFLFIKIPRRNGDHFEGQWVNDKREGQGSYFFASKNKVFVGEWVDDMPKAGVYSAVDDPDQIKINRFCLFYC